MGDDLVPIFPTPSHSIRITVAPDFHPTFPSGGER